jgi:Ser/Thr protein kinase RdoA (MazF antagonist)
MAQVPQLKDAVALCNRLFQFPIKTIARFPTGLSHYVFDVVLNDDQKIVLRIAAAENRRNIDGGIYWSNHLRPIGVPLPALLHADAAAQPFPFMVLQRFPGTDLGHIYKTLSPAQKRTLANQLAPIQARVGNLPQGRGYGFVFHPEGPFQHITWRSVLEDCLMRAHEWIKSVPQVDLRRLRQIENRLAHDDVYLSTITPTPFLDDITTKNVIIDAGRLTGIVDVDEICFGDPLFALALTRMSLLSSGDQTDYIDYWSDALALTDQQLHILDLYTAMHCTSFIGQLGQAFNRDAPSPSNAEEPHRLLNILDELLRED